MSGKEQFIPIYDMMMSALESTGCVFHEQQLNSAFTGRRWERVKGWFRGAFGKIKDVFNHWIKPIASTVVTVLPPPASLIGTAVVNAADKGIKLVDTITTLSNQKKLLGLAQDDTDDAIIECVPQMHVCTNTNNEPDMLDPLDPGADNEWQNIEGVGSFTMSVSPKDVGPSYVDGMVTRTYTRKNWDGRFKYLVQSQSSNGEKTTIQIRRVIRFRKHNVPSGYKCVISLGGQASFGSLINMQ